MAESTLPSLSQPSAREWLRLVPLRFSFLASLFDYDAHPVAAVVLGKIAQHGRFCGLPETAGGLLTGGSAAN